MKTQGSDTALVALLVLAVSGRTATRQIADVQFKPPEGIALQAVHYFDAVLPLFEAIVSSAALPQRTSKAKRS